MDWFLGVAGADAMETDFRTTNIPVSMIYNFVCVQATVLENWIV